MLDATFGRIDMLNYVNAEIAGREFRWKNFGYGPPDRVVDYVEEQSREVLAASGRLPCWAVHLPFAWQYHSEELIAGIRMFAASGCVAGSGQSCPVVVDDGADRRFADLEEIRDIYRPPSALPWGQGGDRPASGSGPWRLRCAEQQGMATSATWIPPPGEERVAFRLVLIRSQVDYEESEMYSVDLALASDGLPLYFGSLAMPPGRHPYAIVGTDVVSPAAAVEEEEALWFERLAVVSIDPDMAEVIGERPVVLTNGPTAVVEDGTIALDWHCIAMSRDPDGAWWPDTYKPPRSSSAFFSVEPYMLVDAAGRLQSSEPSD